MSETETLSAREKGDIYWRKLKYYLNAVETKQKAVETAVKGKNFAKEILTFDEDKMLDDIKSGRVSISGNEFKLRPPTATGRRLYKYGIRLVLKSRDYYKGILADKSNVSTQDLVILEQLEKLVKSMDGVITLWFASNGVEVSNGEKTDRTVREEAEKKLDKSIKAYENTAKSFKLNVAKAIIERLMKEIPRCKTEYDDSLSHLEKLIEDNPGNYRLHKSKITKALQEYKLLKEKRLMSINELSLINKLVDKKGRYSVVNSIMTLNDVVTEYKDDLDVQMSAVYWGELACRELVEALLTGEPADPMVANYIKSHWNVSVPTYPVLQIVESFPGYKIMDTAGDGTDVYSYESIGEILEAVKELAEYKDDHYDLFQFQTIRTLLFGAGEMPLIEAKAKAIRNSLAALIKEGKLASLDEETAGAVENAWLTADTISRVAYLVIDYHNSSKMRVLRDLIENFPNEAYELNYTVQERRCREYMDIFLRFKEQG